MFFLQCACRSYVIVTLIISITKQSNNMAWVLLENRRLHPFFFISVPAKSFRNKLTLFSSFHLLCDVQLLFMITLHAPINEL